MADLEETKTSQQSNHQSGSLPLLYIDSEVQFYSGQIKKNSKCFACAF